MNPGSVVQFDFHQSDKSNVSLSLLTFLSSNDLMESDRVKEHRLDGVQHPREGPPARIRTMAGHQSGRSVGASI